jgi:uncharacterized membrane protein (UPF0182 family)
MRAPGDLSSVRVPRRPRRVRWWLIALAVVVIALIASLKSIVILWTDSLWFSSVGQHRVWSTLIGVKVGLFAAFGAVFFVGLWANLIACDRLAGVPAEDAEDELVRRYQQAVRPYAGRVYAAIALILALIAASGTIGEWQNWILFRNSTNFGVTDPQFHRDVSYYVFRLPFETFVVNWLLVSLVVILVVTAIFHYLNGGIRAQRVSPRVRPAVKAHLSLLLALIALTKAAGYYLQRYNLLNAQDGYVNGAGYTDVHARLPAYLLLILVSIAVAGLLLYNIWRQGWLWPVIAVGVWAFVALVVGVIYPAVLQALRVTPAQSSLEQPYIQRNIDATRAAYNVDHIAQQQVTGKPSLSSPASLAALQPTLDNVRLWDPDPTISQLQFQKRQNTRSYYTFQSIGVDRYKVGGHVTPVVIGVRQLDPSGIPSPSWVNTHLQYTHGEGAALAPANQVSTTGTGKNNPNYTIRNVPPVSDPGYPSITQPDVYFGLNDPGYVVADTKQAELDYPTPAGTVSTHYRSTGGVRIGNWFVKAAFSLRLGDFNLLVSSQVTNKSRIMFVRDVMAMAQKVAPFLSYDHDPYAAVVNGHVDWIINGYTTSAGYPYSQNANSQLLPPGSGLPGSYNYVRNSVVVVVDAYSGSITFYDVDPKDPVLQAYSKAFPGLFTPAKDMPKGLDAHLRYPEDIFSVQASMYGRYHLTNAQSFYTSANAWSVSPTSGVSQSLNASTQIVGGVQVTGPPLPMSPLYQVMQEPGTSGQRLTELAAYVPYQPAQQTTTPSAQNMTGFLIGDSDPGNYGNLTVYKEPTNVVVQGPAQAEAAISQNSTVSSQFTLLDQHGTYAEFGNILVIPLGQTVLYVRPLYTASRSNPQPQLTAVIAAYNGSVVYEPTKQAAISGVFGPNAPTVGGSGTPPTTGTSGTPSSKVAADIASALSAYAQAQQALKNGDLQTYANQIANMHAAIQAANRDLSAVPGTTTTTAPHGTASTTTTTKAPAASSSAHTAVSHRTSSTTTTKPGET